MSMASLILLLLAQAGEPERVVVTGTIIGADAKPAATADVLLAEGSPPLTDLVRRTGTVRRPPAVMRREKTGTSGEFRVELPVDDVRIQRLRRPLFLWAFGPAGSLALRPIPDDWPRDGEPLHLTLAQSEPVRFRVVGPEERPLAGVRLTMARLRGVDVPVDLGTRFEVETDAKGMAIISIGAARELEVIRLTSGPFGVQQLRVSRPDAEGIHTLRLLAVGRVVGQIVAGDPLAVRGLPVRLRTEPDPAADVAGVGGLASVVTDDQGRFTVPAIATGRLAISLDFRWDLPWRSSPPMLNRPQVQPATTTELTITLRPAAKVTGVVQEMPGGRPVAGVGVALTTDVETPLAPTDAEGRFSAYLAPGIAVEYPVGVPRGYCSPTNFANSQPIPEGVKELTLKPLTLNLGVEVRGQVVHAQGKPVPGADVSGHYELGNGFQSFIHAVTDRHGRFRLESIPPTTTLHLSANRNGATTAAPEAIGPGKEPITLRISPEHAVALYGRIKDPSSRPLAGATVRVSARKLGPQDSPIEQRTISFDDEGRTTLHTGADGQFRTPRQLRPDLQYRVEVEADDYVPASTEWVKPDEFRQRYFPGIVLQPIAPTRTVAGRVVDAQGRPVASAVVFQSGDGPAPTRSLTDADGHFELPGVYRERAFLFVERAGLAFQGYRIQPGTESVELKTRRAGDPPGPPLRTLAPTLARDQEKALALKLIEADLTPLTEKIEPAETSLLARALPRLDIERALELVDDKAVPHPLYDNQLRLECARALFGEQPAAATAIADAIPDLQLRSRFYRDASDTLPKTDRARKPGLLEKALVHARGIKEPVNKLVALGMIGCRLPDLSETERGTRVLREGQQFAGTLPKFVAGQRNNASHGRGLFAAKLARIDAAAAFALAEGYSDPPHDWYFGGVALGLADRDPAGSERAMGMLKMKVRRDQIVIRAAGRMAAIDRSLSRRLAEALERPSDQVVALASMARGLAGSDPNAAIALLDEALGRLSKSVGTGGEQPRDPRDVACLIPAEMLATAEQLAPELLRRCFWRAVALRPPRPSGNDPSFAYEQAASSLAMRLARYDRGVARQVLEPAARRVRSLDYGRRSWARILFAAATIIDPSWAVSLADSLRDDQLAADLHPKTSMRRVIADVLAHGSPDQWDESYRAQLNEYVFWRMFDSKDEER